MLNIFRLKIAIFLIIFIFAQIIKSNGDNNFNKYFFTMYSSNKSQTPYILNAYTPSEYLKVDFSKKGLENLITKESTSDYANPNISSIYFYDNDYMVKTCFGKNKIIEIVPQNETSTNSKHIFSPANINIPNNFIFCYSTKIQNPDTTIKESKAIITYWVEINSQNEYIHKCVLFFPSYKRFSQKYTLSSSQSFQISNKFPTYCTTFREKDIFCSFYDKSNLNNQFIIETNKIIPNAKNEPSIYFVFCDFGQIKGNNMKPIALNKQIKSIFGGYYDVFLAEFHNNQINEKNSTVMLYSLYRKSLHASIVPMFANLELFFGTNIRDAYVEINLFNYIIESTEMILFFIYKNQLRAYRVDYSVQNNLFKNFSEIQNLGYFSQNLENCKIPKYMQSSYITNLIKYNLTESKMVNENKKRHYIYQQDISVLISCSNSNKNDEVNYEPKIIEMPQCLNSLDSINGINIHKINFYLSIGAIIYDIYDDPRLKSFRNVGIIFYPYESHFDGLIIYKIKLSSEENYITPKNNQLYKNITHILFQRQKLRYVPVFSKPFHLKYRLFNLETSNSNKVNNISSNECFFQIKFFPYDKKNNNGINNNENDNGSDNISDNVNDNYENLATNEKSDNRIEETYPKIEISTTSEIVPPEENEEEEENDELCPLSYCAVCDKDKNKELFCKICDSSELEVIVKDEDEESETFGKCICDRNLGFYKEPMENICVCQEDNAYYKSTNLCWPEKILKYGPYFIENIDDITEIPIYNDCYATCSKCSKGGDEKNNNCDECKDGFAFIDDDTSNCYDINELNIGYHEVDPHHYIKCHDNCISCSDRPLYDEEKKNVIKQFCTECKNFVPYYLRENLEDKFFNCFEKKCDENVPSLLFLYSEKSNECVKNCENGLKPYNNSKVCLLECNNDYPFLEISTKNCFSSCEYNDIQNKISNLDKGICTNECEEKNLPGDKCSSCEEKMYKNKEGNCVKIPKQCSVVDINSGLCKVCNNGFYPLKEDSNKDFFDCYETIEDIIKATNRTDFYLNETEKYWDECYKGCEACYGYGSENRQRCKSCKYGYHFEYYFENAYNNCRLNLSSNENCTSSQVDIYKYKDYCHLCKEGYSFVNGTDICMSTEELKNGPFYESEINIKTGENRSEEIKVKIFYSCYKTCLTCKEKGDYYDHKCISCLYGFIFDKKQKKCIIDKTINNIIEPTYNLETYKPEISDSEDNIWFKLGENSFYFYRQNNCIIIFYNKKIFLISNKKDCTNICTKWNNNNCELKNYTRFQNMTRKEYDNLINEAYEYDSIKKNVNIILNDPKKKLYFHLTNYVSNPPKNLSYIDISSYQNLIKQQLGSNILLLKVDIKREDTQSTQVEYQFYNPNYIIDKINLNKFLRRRRLDTNKDQDNNNDFHLNIDLPVSWTEGQIENINYLEKQNIDAFNSSSNFYIDNCNQFTSAKGNDVFLKERKKIYYPDIPLCENNCTFVKYNSDTQKVTCQCNYKQNSENYKDVVFVSNPVDKRFLKNLFFENFHTMKCFEVIFKWENLKANAGFIIMIIFIIIFASSFALYYLSLGFRKLDKFINEVTKEKNVKFIIQKLNRKKQNLFNSVRDMENEKKQEEPIKEEGEEIEEEDFSFEKGKTGEGGLIDDEPKEKIPKKIENNEFLSINKLKQSEGGDINPNPKDKKIDPKKPEEKYDSKGKGAKILISDSESDSQIRNNPNYDIDSYISGYKRNNTNKKDGSEINKKNPINKDQEKEINNNSILGSLNQNINNKEDENIKNNNKNNSDGIEKKENKKQKPDNPKENSDNQEKKEDKDNLISEDSDSQNKNINNNDNNANKKDENNNNNNINNEPKKDYQKEEGISQEIEVNNNPLLGSINNNINNKEEDEKKGEELIDENNISNLNINKTFKTIKQSEHQNEENEKSKEEDNSSFYVSNFDPNELIVKPNIEYSNRSKENPILEKADSAVTDNELDPQKKKSYDRDSDMNSIFDRAINLPELEGKKRGYDVDSDINKSDLISNFSNLDAKSEKSSNIPPNPPKFTKNNDKSEDEKDVIINLNKNFKNNQDNFNNLPKSQIQDNLYGQPSATSKPLKQRKKSDEGMKDSQFKDEHFGKIGKFIQDKFSYMNKTKIDNELIKKKIKLMTLDEFGQKYNSFPLIYLAGLKKHHLIYFTFCACNDNNNLFLKLSFFSLTVNFYFGLNTMFIFDSNMSEAYYDKEKAKPSYILMNLCLPFIICGFITFIVKLLVMPAYIIHQMIKKIQDNETLNNLIMNGNYIGPSQVIEVKNPKKKKHVISNGKKNIQPVYSEYQQEIDKLEKEFSSIYKLYKIKVIIYFISSSIILGLNWYFMTSFCAIFKNTGLKLIVNSVVSLLASFIFPFILGLIPTSLGFLAVKLNNELIFRIYKKINFVI